MLKALATILTLIVVCALLGIGVYGWWRHQSAATQIVHAQEQAGSATVSAGQAQASTAAQRIIVAGEGREHVDVTLHAENANAIAQAPGSAAALDPALIATVNRGLCHYAAESADPRCAQLRAADPAQLPVPGSLGGSARPD